uniref:Uncharacterized protein n=1 Tax=Spongospora subterranea TaxID=70186 RepID=A0A0H5QPZ4_9EUKA|eukprot:CRZ04113.1 hypothetical protein [Spongospora subterranea]
MATVSNATGEVTAAIVNVAAAPLLAVTGSILVKLEIMINFLQMYSLVYAINLNIPWPKLWIDLSFYVVFFSFDIDLVFSFKLSSLAVLKFFVIMALPLIFILFYLLGASLDVETFRRRFVTNWSNTKFKAWCVLVSWFLISFGSSMALYQSNIQRVQNLKMTDGNFNGLMVQMMSPMLAILAIWYFIAWRFRANCVDVAPEDFLRWWYKGNYMIRRISLFSITVLFLPVARVIMQQFQVQKHTTHRFLFLVVASSIPMTPLWHEFNAHLPLVLSPCCGQLFSAAMIILYYIPTVTVFLWSYI